jgi:tetratricopeptide (TPR) repeat protein
MKIPFELKGFKGRDLQVRIRFFGRPKLIVDEKVVRRINKRYPVTNNEGHVISVGLKRRFLDPVPNLEVAGHELIILPPHRWYEYIWLLLPSALLVAGWFEAHEFGIVLALIWALVALYLNTKSFRLIPGSVAKYVVNGSVLVVSSLALFVSIVAIPLMQELARIAEIKTYLVSREVPEIHNGRHDPSGEFVSDTTHTFTDEFGYPRRRVDKTGLRMLFELGRTQKLDSVLASYQSLFERDYRYEDLVSEAFGIFDVPDSSLEGLFDRWVASMPNSFVPYLARAEYYHSLGWANRGFAWASETSQQQFSGMEFFFAKAEKDCRAALDRQPQVLRTFEIFMNIARARGDIDVSSMIMQHAARLCPCSFRVRDRFMMNLLPRWGGSYEAMTLFAVESQEQVNLNPKMKLLLGYAAWDQARVLSSAKQYSDALEYVSKALMFGEGRIFLALRGNIFDRMDRHEDAIAEYDRALLKYPDYAEVAVDKARCLYNLGRFDASAAAVRYVEAMEPWNEDLLTFKKSVTGSLIYDGYQFYKGKDYGEAIARYNAALAFDPQYAPAYYYRGLANVYQGQLDVALSDFRKAISLNPRDYESYRLLDWVLVQYGDWDSIIVYWTQYIKLMPEDGRAYRERGGAYFHKPDYPAALADAEKACSLGVRDACDQIPRIKAQIGR